jgi:arginyl-tRNA--protein-N-Asp/Glu arginylyltransferase
MKLLFSEARPDYAHYIFPYAIWAFPEAGETPADLFNAGFLPSSRNLDRFYLCRQLRVRLADFTPSSENRRVLRKGEGLTATLIPRAEFELTPTRRQFYQTYAAAKFSAAGMSDDRLTSLFHSAITSHVLVFTEATGKEVGAVTVYLVPDALAYYYYAFYDLNHPVRNLGIFMMTTATELFAARGFRYLYLGSCYSQNALYKTQFAGIEFFNGFRWSDNLAELKFVLARSQGEIQEHLLESELYRAEFHGGDLANITNISGFRVHLER